MRLYSAAAIIVALCITVALPGSASAQRRPGQGRGGGATGAPTAQGPQGSLQQPTLRPYEEVVTEDAKTQDGVFTVHQIKGRVLWEIPKEMLGRVFLWETEIAQVPEGGTAYLGFAAGTHTVVFERRENYIYLRERDFGVRTESKGGLALGVAASTVDPIIAAFPVEAEGKEKEAVIDVSRLFTSDQAPFSVGTIIGSTGVDLTRSYIDRVSDFPTNIETRSLLTFQTPAAKTALVHYSLDLLPEKPMQPRFRDDRVGFFGSTFETYGRDNRAESLTYIDRFRLEKKDPTAAMSEPVKPITFYLSREVPNQLRPYLKKAVEDWNVAFEKAGFEHAIVCKNAPSMEEDPTWDPEDARYSVIRWVPSTTQNAQGPHVSDPRSGETISAHITVWHNVLNLVQHWYFSQASALDPKARHLPFSDDLIGRLMEYVVCHEVGHTLGLEHNFRASTIYSAKQLRTPGFVSQHGVASSIMSYSRFNYVAQPGDGLSEEDLMGRIGAYDKFAIAWGYTPIPNAHNPDEEKPTLDRWAAQQLDHPEFQFANYVYSEDPTTQMEVIGNDPVTTGELGLRNIRREVQYVLPSVMRTGDPYDQARDLYTTLVGQRFSEINRASLYIGGVVEINAHMGHGGAVFHPVPKAEQEACAQFVTHAGFRMPPELLERSLLTRLYPDGDLNRVVRRQAGLINSLLSEARIGRMLDNEAENGHKAYTAAQLAADLQNGVWEELDDHRPTIDVYRRALQQQYLDVVDSRINGENATKTDLNAIERDGLRRLARKIDHAIPSAANEATARHLRDCRRVIGLIVNARYSPTVVVAPAAAPAPTGRGPRQPIGCWPELPGWND